MAVTDRLLAVIESDGWQAGVAVVKELDAEQAVECVAELLKLVSPQGEDLMPVYTGIAVRSSTTSEHARIYRSRLQHIMEAIQDLDCSHSDKSKLSAAAIAAIYAPISPRTTPWQRRTDEQCILYEACYKYAQQHLGRLMLPDLTASRGSGGDGNMSDDETMLTGAVPGPGRAAKHAPGSGAGRATPAAAAAVAAAPAAAAAPKARWTQQAAAAARASLGRDAAAAAMTLSRKDQARAAVAGPLWLKKSHQSQLPAESEGAVDFDRDVPAASEDRHKRQRQQPHTGGEGGSSSGASRGDAAAAAAAPGPKRRKRHVALPPLSEQQQQQQRRQRFEYRQFTQQLLLQARAAWELEQQFKKVKKGKGRAPAAAAGAAGTNGGDGSGNSGSTICRDQTPADAGATKGPDQQDIRGRNAAAGAAVAPAPSAPAAMAEPTRRQQHSHQQHEHEQARMTASAGAGSGRQQLLQVPPRSAAALVQIKPEPGCDAAAAAYAAAGATSNTVARRTGVFKEPAPAAAAASKRKHGPQQQQRAAAGEAEATSAGAAVPAAADTSAAAGAGPHAAGAPATAAGGGVGAAGNNQNNGLLQQHPSASANQSAAPGGGAPLGSQWGGGSAGVMRSEGVESVLMGFAMLERLQELQVSFTEWLPAHSRLLARQAQLPAMSDGELRMWLGIFGASIKMFHAATPDDPNDPNFNTWKAAVLELLQQV